MAQPRLPRRKVTAHGVAEVVDTGAAIYRFRTDALTCGHRIYWDRDRPASRGCWDCAAGRPPGFHDATTGAHNP